MLYCLHVSAILYIQYSTLAMWTRRSAILSARFAILYIQYSTLAMRHRVRHFGDVGSQKCYSVCKFWRFSAYSIALWRWRSWCSLGAKNVRRFVSTDSFDVLWQMWNELTETQGLHHDRVCCGHSTDATPLAEWFIRLDDHELTAATLRHHPTPPNLVLLY